MECFLVLDASRPVAVKGLIKVTKESCCYGYPVTKGNKSANEYSRKLHTFYSSGNRNRISHIDPELEDFAQLIDLSAFSH